MLLSTRNYTRIVRNMFFYDKSGDDFLISLDLLKCALSSSHTTRTYSRKCIYFLSYIASLLSVTDHDALSEIVQ